MVAQIKTRLRDLIPMRYQVPIKHWADWTRGSLEGEIALLKMLVNHGDRAVDVGGHRGAYAYSLWKLGAWVEVFEPNPVCNRVLSAWAARKSKIQIHGVGLSDQEGTASLSIPVDESGVEHDASASLENHNFTNARQQSISLNTLDSFNFKEVHFVKIDVEGHEYKVIEGAKKTLSLCKPILLIEIEQRHSERAINEVFEQVDALGYQGFFLTGDGLVVLDDFVAEVHQALENLEKPAKTYINNFIFLHRSKLEKDAYHRLFQGNITG